MSLQSWFREQFPAAEPVAVFTGTGAVGDLLDALRSVIDPELDQDIVSMGLIRQARVDAGQGVVVMTLTTPGCPMAGMLIDHVQTVIEDQGLTPVVSVTHEPPWSPEQMEPR